MPASDHNYLFKTLRAFGFGERFLTWMGLLYADAVCMINMGRGTKLTLFSAKGYQAGLSSIRATLLFGHITTTCSFTGQADWF